MHNWHTYEQLADEVMRERLAEAGRARLVRLARSASPGGNLAWPRRLVWTVGCALVAVGERLVAVARAYDLRERTWSPSTKSYAGG
jgi:hypothetical protein